MIRDLVHRIAFGLAPIRGVSVTAVLAADRLARTEEDFEVFEPMGEYPPLTDVPGVERTLPPDVRSAGHPQLAAVATVIRRHWGDIPELHHYAAVQCSCGRLADSWDDHSRHVAALCLEAAQT